MSSSNCENVPLMFKIDACIELVQTKFMDYSPIKKIYFITIVYYLKFLLCKVLQFCHKYRKLWNFLFHQLSQYCHYYDFQTNFLIGLY